MKNRFGLNVKLSKHVESVFPFLRIKLQRGMHHNSLFWAKCILDITQHISIELHQG